MKTPNTDSRELLDTIFWSQDKEKKVEALNRYTANKQLEARYDELMNINWGNAGYATIARQYVYDRLNELDNQLKNKKESL